MDTPQSPEPMGAPTPAQQSTMPPVSPAKKSPASMVILIILIVLALIAAMYFYGMSLKGGPEASTTDTSEETDPETAAIEKDLDETNIDSSTESINQIDASF